MFGKFSRLILPSLRVFPPSEWRRCLQNRRTGRQNQQPTGTLLPVSRTAFYGAPPLPRIRSKVPSVKTAEVLRSGIPLPARPARSQIAATLTEPTITITPANVRAAEIATRELNAGFLNVILTGKYTDAFLKYAGKDTPKYTAADGGSEGIRDNP